MALQNVDTKLVCDYDNTEGYHLIPNFFIRATIWTKSDGNNGQTLNLGGHLELITDANVVEVSDKDPIYHYDRCKGIIYTEEWPGRLFDRGTRFLAIYNANFMRILTLYAQDNPTEKEFWKKEVYRKVKEDLKSFIEGRYPIHESKSALPPRVGEHISDGEGSHREIKWLPRPAQ